MLDVERSVVRSVDESNHATIRSYNNETTPSALDSHRRTAKPNGQLNLYHGRHCTANYIWDRLSYADKEETYAFEGEEGFTQSGTE